MPPTLITRRLEDARAFHAEHGEVVVKPLYGNAGSAVFHVGRKDANLAALTELFGQVWREPFMVQAFHAEHGEVVVKPLYGNAGSAVFHVGRADANLAALTELFGRVWREPFMVQAFLPEVVQGDKRIVLVDGKVAGAVNRVPKDGEIRSNLAVGGRAAPTELSPREQEICDAMGPELARRGLLFVGIDVIGGYLTEINVTSPTGIVSIDTFNGSDTPAMIWDAIEAKQKAAHG
jgi:glutathione synthase